LPVILTTLLMYEDIHAALIIIVGRSSMVI
jgi:hypothetical protein